MERISNLEKNISKRKKRKEDVSALKGCGKELEQTDFRYSFKCGEEGLLCKECQQQGVKND